MIPNDLEVVFCMEDTLDLDHIIGVWGFQVGSRYSNQYFACFLTILDIPEHTQS
jgi:hypothetical protein